MSERMLAQGHKWTITHETSNDRVYLSLVSIYGTVEFVPHDMKTLEVLESIEREYNKLKEQGPIERVTEESRGVV